MVKKSKKSTKKDTAANIGSEVHLDKFEDTVKVVEAAI